MVIVLLFFAFADAVRLIVAGEVNAWPMVGLVRLTAGGGPPLAAKLIK